LGQEVTQDSRREFESGHRCADHRRKGRWEEGVDFDTADSDVDSWTALSTLTLMLHSKT